MSECGPLKQGGFCFVFVNVCGVSGLYEYESEGDSNSWEFVLIICFLQPGNLFLSWLGPYFLLFDYDDALVEQVFAILF